MQLHHDSRIAKRPEAVDAAEQALRNRLAIQAASSSPSDVEAVASVVASKARALQAAVLANKPTALLRKQLTAMLSAYGAYLDFDPDPRCVNVAVRFRVDDGKPDTWRRAIIFR